MSAIKITERLEQELGREVSEEEIIKEVVGRLKKKSKRSEGEVKLTLSLKDSYLSLD